MTANTKPCGTHQTPAPSTVAAPESRSVTVTVTAPEAIKGMS